MCEVLDKSKLEEKESNGILKKITNPFSKKKRCSPQSSPGLNQPMVETLMNP